MTVPRQRMFPPQAATDYALQPLLKRAVYFACHQIAEDSGCFIWNPRLVRSVAAPMEPGVVAEQIEALMLQLVEDGYLWRYKAAGLECAFVAAFPEWQHSLNRRNAPERVPLPPGIDFEQDESNKNRHGSGRYTYPQSKEAMASGTLSHSTNQSSTLPASHSVIQGGASSERADSEQPADRCPLCAGSKQTVDGMSCYMCNGTGVKR